MLRKLLLALALLLMVSLGASGQGTRVDRVGYSYCPRGEQYLYLYDSSSTFNVLANVKCGERVDILGSENGYVIVRTADGKQGYVPLDGITSTPPVKARGARESTASRLPQPAVAEIPTPPVKPPAARESTTSRLPQPAVAETPTRPAKVPAAPEPTTSRLPQPAVAETPTPPMKAPAAPEPTTSRLPQPAVAEAPTPPAKAPAAPEAPIIGPPRRTPSETSAPLLEIFGGYSYLNFDTNKLSSRQSFNGWESSVALHVNRWLAAEGSISGYYKNYSLDLTALGLGRLQTNVHDLDFLGGPRINFQRMFFHALLGIEHLTASGLGYSAAENSFAAAFGGGGQWRINRQWAVRASADFLVTRHNLLNAQTPITQNNIRTSGGVVYTFRPRSE